MAIRAAVRMDGGTAVVRRAIETHPEHPRAAALIRTLARSPDNDAAAAIVRDLADRPDPRSREIALRVMSIRGLLPDLKPIVGAAVTDPKLTDATRDAARTILEDRDPQIASLMTAYDPPEGPAEETTPVETGGR
jgi:hypothetical protein